MNKDKLIKFAKLFFYYGAIATNFLLVYGIIKLFSCISGYFQWIIYATLGGLALLFLIMGVTIRRKIMGSAGKLIIYWLVILAVFYCTNLLAAKNCMPLYYGY